MTPLALQRKVNRVTENWANENLQTIRTLMERTAIYRRALAPVSLVTGLIGILSAVLGCVFSIKGGFIIWWMVTGLLASIVGFLQVRSQALKDQEAIWSPPTRRVVQAIIPPLVSGCFMGFLFYFLKLENEIGVAILPIIWMLFFGSAMHSAGFFMKRGIRLLGWVFIVTAIIDSIVLIAFKDLRFNEFAAHIIMGAVFGGYNLAYCIYLYVTEKGELE